MTPMDQIYQQVVALYNCESVWSANKILPKYWTKWRDDKRSQYQMIIKRVALPVGLDGKS